MARNLRAIRRKIRTVHNIHQITRAMKMVAAARLKRIQGQVENGRAYWDRLDEIMGRVAHHAGEVTHPFLEPRQAEQIGVLVIGGARGLCGSYNVNLLRHAEEFLGQVGRPARLMTVGAKAYQYFTKRGYDVQEHFSTPEDELRLLQSADISRAMRDLFLSGQVAEVHVVFTEFFSALRCVPRDRRLFPLEAPKAQEDTPTQYLFEPPAQQLLGSLLPRAVDAAVYRMLLQSAASEEGARMAAMTSATDNAEKMGGTLTRDLNRARQAQVTTELLEVIAGADALVGGG